MFKFKNLIKGHCPGMDTLICAVKDTSNVFNEDFIKEMLLSGKYWIKKQQGNEITPAIPEELMGADATIDLIGTGVDIFILVPDFDQEAYWNTVGKNPPWFRKKLTINTDISCEKILKLDAENNSLVEDFKAMAASNNLTHNELMGYLIQKLD